MIHRRWLSRVQLQQVQWRRDRGGGGGGAGCVVTEECLSERAEGDGDL